MRIIRPLLPALVLTALVIPACRGGRSSTAIPAPAVQGFTPASAFPGASVSIQGSGFTGATQVTFGGVQALTFQVQSDARISATVPPGAATGPVRVVTPSGGAGSAATFTVVPLPAAPSVTAFSPATQVAGQKVTLTGSNFTNATAVQFGGVPSPGIDVVNDTTLIAIVPAGAGKGLISVVSPGGTGSSNGDFTPTPPPPSLAALATTQGAPGDPVVLTGTGFTGATSVQFGGREAPGFAVDSDTRISVKVPAAAATGPVTVTTPGGTATTAPAIFTVLGPAATAAGFCPASGAEGDDVAVTGTSLGRVTGVRFGSTAAAFQVSADGATLTAKVPPGAATGPLALDAPGGTLTVPGGAFVVTSPRMTVTGFSPTSGVAGSTVTARGTNLDQVSAVTLGGAAAPGLAVAADKASLTFAVPNGTNGGPVVLTTAGGPVAVPGGDFTVTPSTPVIATLTPASGVPGTEVALDGSGLASATQVAYAGLVLNSSRFDIDGDTRIRVRIPDDAQAGGVLTVTTAAGSATAPAFTLLPSRRGVLPQPLEKIDGTFGEGPWVNFPGGRRSAMYGLLEPMAPVFHAYNPDGLDNATPPVDCNRPGHTHTRFTVNLKLPQAFYAFLPASVRDRIAAQGIDPANVDIFCVSQDYQYDGTTPEGGVYLFRPHYWTDPDVPVSGSIATLNHNLSAAIFETDPLLPVTISGNVPGVFFDFAISTHEAGGPPPGPIVASGNSEPMAGFDVTGSNGLWSLTQEGPRAAATLHLLFNDADQATLGNLALTSGTVQELVQGMATSLGTTRGVQLLQSLFRPEVASLGQAPAGANKTVTLAGTGLRDATAVLLDGTPSGTVTVVSDTIVKVALPAGVTGNLQVVTPMGASDPVGLPAI